jgi:hypothetical protein
LNREQASAAPAAHCAGHDGSEGDVEGATRPAGSSLRLGSVTTSSF